MCIGRGRPTLQHSTDHVVECAVPAQLGRGLCIGRGRPTLQHSTDHVAGCAVPAQARADLRPGARRPGAAAAAATELSSGAPDRRRTSGLNENSSQPIGETAHDKARLRVRTRSHTVSGLKDTVADLNIGTFNNSTTTSRWRGVLDEVRLSNAVLDPTQLLIVPEPSALGLAALGLLMLRRRGER